MVEEQTDPAPRRAPGVGGVGCFGGVGGGARRTRRRRAVVEVGRAAQLGIEVLEQADKVETDRLGLLVREAGQPVRVGL